MIDIIADPTALGSEEGVLDLLDDLAAPNATIDDVALGTVAWRDAWWTWSGAAFNGEPFSLPVIGISTYDGAGRTISAVIHWPCERADVECVVSKGDQACAVTGAS